MNFFKLICIEGADKTGKTTLSNTLRKHLIDIQYWHFTTCQKKSFLKYDVPLQRNVNVLYQFYDFFNQHFLKNIPKNAYLLDRTLFSDIIYGPFYRGNNDELIVRQIETNYFHMLLQALDTVFIYANNSDIDKSYSEIEKENEGVIKTRQEYDFLRKRYNEVIYSLYDKNDHNFIEYDFNVYERSTDFVDVVISKMNNQNDFFNELVKYNVVGQIIGDIHSVNKREMVELRFVEDYSNNSPITIQDYANVIVENGKTDWTKSAPLMNTRNLCIVRKNSKASDILKHFLK